MTGDRCCRVPSGIRLVVQVSPNAKKSEVAGVAGDVLKMRLHAQPIEGKANQQLVRYIARTLDVPKNAAAITHGLTSKRKIIEITVSNLKVDAVKQMLLSASPS